MSESSKPTKNLWVKLSVAYMDDDKIMAVGLEGELVYVRCLAWAKRDGRGEISHHAALRMAYGTSDPLAVIESLVTEGLWVRDERMYRIVAWDDWQTDTAHETRSRLGTLGNHRRWHKIPVDDCTHCEQEFHRQPIANASLSDSPSDRWGIAEIEIEKDIYKDIAQPALSESAPKVSKANLFDEFWQVYPRRVGKGAAVKAHARALKRATPQRILDGAQSVADRWRTLTADERQYIPHPSTWLNADRWDDEPEVIPLAPVSSAGPWSADPECMICAGDGWESTEDERGAYAVRPCPCRVTQ